MYWSVRARTCNIFFTHLFGKWYYSVWHTMYSRLYHRLCDQSARRKLLMRCLKYLTDFRSRFINWSHYSIWFCIFAQTCFFRQMFRASFILRWVSLLRDVNIINIIHGWLWYFGHLHLCYERFFTRWIDNDIICHVIPLTKFENIEDFTWWIHFNRVITNPLTNIPRTRRAHKLH